MFRIVILIATTICLSLMMANMLTLNFCIICMTEEKYVDETIEFDSISSDLGSMNKGSGLFISEELKKNVNLKVILNSSMLVPKLFENEEIRNIKDLEIIETNSNGTIRVKYKKILRPADFQYSPSERSILFSSVAIGALLTISPIGICIHRFGTRQTFLVVMLVSTFSTFIFPVMANFGVIALTICRILQGVGYAACMPIIGSVTSSWARHDENGLFSGALTSFIQLGPVITMPLAGILCSSSFRWPAVFYLHAFLTFIISLLWWYIYRDSPSGCRFVKKSELDDLCKGKSENKRNCSLPWRDICTTPSVWAVWIAAIGNMYSVQLVIVFSPIYMNKILQIPVVSVGFAAALPTLLQFVIKMVAGCLSDRITNFNETIKVRIFNSIAFIGMSTLFIALTLAPSIYPHLSLSLLVASTTILGFNTGGFFKSAILIGQQYSYFINAIMQVIMCLAMLTMPIIVFMLTPNESADEWPRVFFLYAAILFCTNTFFCIFGRGEAAKFTHFSTVKTQCIKE